ncbi:amino acid transporter [Rhizobium sp. Leaf384]|uniref:LysE/ArgO family amino acid transporter n=1 Tax=unclassified Rhizobium TaxID=2613769 RepID=UPI000714E1BA|nr:MULTISPECIES: LysE/ArgO family amino acid transporter [unclassified Rhizobium]KQS80518.1 amino acid transporter [Rhizobium sp. Leaf384]KQS86570.1 amino acid transporter [Rhizobium sp. Leaf383]
MLAFLDETASTAFTTGLAMGLTLIVAIGAQNAFVLRQGLRNEHVFAVCLACAVSDAALIALGVTSFRQIAQILPGIDPIMRYGGAAFLFVYGARSLWSALRASSALDISGQTGRGLGVTLATCLALTWLNPHVYLDTVVLLGTISTRFPGAQAAFAAGAMCASVLFFFSLGYGARWLRPLFEKPAAWRVLEAIIGVVMVAIGARLVIGL